MIGKSASIFLRIKSHLHGHRCWRKKSFVRLVRRLSLEFPEDRSFVGSKIARGQLTEQFVFSSIRWARIKCDQRERSSLSLIYRFECSPLTDRHLLLEAWTSMILSFIFTSVPSNSSRKCELGCIINQTLARVRWLVKITSQVRPARVELFTQVKNN